MILDKIKFWLHAIRIKFLISSIVSILIGLLINYHHHNFINVYYAILTTCGVVLLHISVDLLNDYWDFKRGIDNKTHRTKFSGGTGMLPSGVIKPSHFYFMGMLFLFFGTCIGIYFIYVHGITIAILLIFAISSIYFYSTKIVNYGLSEIFVCTKSAMILIGSYFIQYPEISMDVILTGVNIGLLSSLVLFISSFPDFDADKHGGRRTILIIFGKRKSTIVYWIFPILLYSIIIICVLLSLLNHYCLLVLLTIPLVIKYGVKLRTNYDNINIIVHIIGRIILFSRLYSMLLISGFIIDMVMVN